MPSSPEYPRLREAGASAFSVEFGDSISEELNERANALAGLLGREPPDGFREAIPTYRSVLVLHDPAADPECLRQETLGLAAKAEGQPPAPPRHLELPCVYDGEDLEEVAGLAGVSTEELIGIHSGREYRVFVLGFTPGFPYLGMTDPRLDLPRRSTPRVRVPAGSVALARAQTGVYPWVTPGGWHLLGHTDPALLFDVEKSPPSALAVGDRVRFRPVDALPAPAESAAGRSSAPAGAPSVAPAFAEVEKGGLLTTVQDLGRRGHLRHGVPRAGAADPRSLAGANRAVGNPEGAAGLECTLLGPQLRFPREALLALGGADFGAQLELPEGVRWRVPVGTSFVAPAGSRLRFAGPPSGARAYLAVAGGLLVPPVLGSASTYRTSGFGGLEGRALRPGDRLCAGDPGPEAGENRYEPEARRAPSGSVTLRLSLGPQDDCFTEDCLEALEDLEWTVSNDSDRMGVRLGGPLLTHRPGRKEIVSDANPPGAVQVPPGGLPIVMGADQGTTGGYPKIGCVVAPDLARLAQALPGSPVRFRVVSSREAREITLSEPVAAGE